MQCHECGAAISDRAADCPYCGTSVSGGGEGSADGDGDPPDGRPTVSNGEPAASSGSGVSESTDVDAEGAGKSHDTAYDEFGRPIDRPSEEGNGIGGDGDGGNGDGEDGDGEDGRNAGDEDRSVDGHCDGNVAGDDDVTLGEGDAGGDGPSDADGRAPSVPSSGFSDRDSRGDGDAHVDEPSAERDDSTASKSGASDESDPGVPATTATDGRENEGAETDGEDETSVSDDENETSVSDDENERRVSDGESVRSVSDDESEPSVSDDARGSSAEGLDSTVDGREPATPRSPAEGPGTVGEGADSGPTTAGGAETVGGRDEAADPSTGEEAATRDDGESDEGFDPVAFVSGIPWLPSAVAGVATALVLFIIAVLVAVAIPSAGPDALELGALVLLDLHFATPAHATPLLFDNFEVARPPDASLGMLYLLPPVFVYTASKAVVAFNVDADRSLPFAALSGATLVVGYFPVVLVALFVAPPRPGGLVAVLGAVVIAGLLYPVAFGAVGGLFGGAFTGTERNVGTLYGLVTAFLVMVGAFALSFPAFGSVVDVDLLSRVLLSLFTFVGANAFSLGGSGTNVAILLVYPLVAGAVFAAGFLRAFRAPDVESPARGFAKGLTPAVTYVVVLGVLAAVLPVFADGYVQAELGLGFGATVVVDSLVFGRLVGIGQYATVLVVGTLVYPVLLGGGAGALAGGIRLATSD